MPIVSAAVLGAAPRGASARVGDAATPQPTSGGRPAVPAPTPPAPVAPAASLTTARDSAEARVRSQMELEKLRAEVAKLHAETAEIGSVRSQAPLISAVVGLIALFGAAFRYLQQIRKDREQEADKSFAAAVELLGSDKPNARASGAVSIVVFADAKYGRLRRMVIDVLLAQLRVAPDAAQQRLLAASFSRAAALLGALDDLDAAGADLSHVDLRDVRLPRANLAECHLTHAAFQRTRLTNAVLRGAECREAQFSRCDLGGATFDGALLNQVQLADCELGGASLNDVRLTTCRLGARMSGARFRNCAFFQCDFTGADVSGTEFGPQQDIDVQSAKSLRGAPGFERARLDAGFRKRLDGLVGVVTVGVAPSATS